MFRKLFKRLMYLFTAPNELDELISALADQRHEQERLNEMHRLDLCYKHRQEKNHSHYSEQNCHYCQIQNHVSLQWEEILQLRKRLQS